MSALLKALIVAPVAWWVGSWLVLRAMRWRGYSVTDLTEYNVQVTVAAVVILVGVIYVFHEWIRDL